MENAPNYFIQLYLHLTFLLLMTNQQIINNPFNIYSEFTNPIIFKASNTTYNIITSGIIYVFDSTTSQFKFSRASDDYIFSSPYFLCIDESNKYFLYANKDYYQIDLNSALEIENLNKIKTINSNVNFYDYIKQFEFDRGNNVIEFRSNADKNEIILYGKKEKNIYFYYISKDKGFEAKINDNKLGEQMSCKLIDSVRYVCAYNIGEKVKVSILMLTKVGNTETLNVLKTEDNNNFNKNDNILLIDTKNKEEKILCSKNLNNNKAICSKLQINVYFNTIDFNNIDIDFEIPFDIKNCDFTWFSSEFLFCCMNSNIISCNRMNAENYEIINKFKINLYGENSFLYLINNTNYASIFYKSENSNSTSNLYEYIIYPPTCSDISKEILVYQDFEINLNEMFEMKTNNTYLLQFESLPLIYGNMTLNGELLNNISEQMHIKNIENLLYFISTNEQSGYNISIPYNVNVKEITYSSKCKIDLTILPCYTSCKKCSKAFSKSNIYNHNCLIGECKPNYYQSPLNPYNCFMITEKPSSWYFDYANLSFGLCNSECETCFGPNNSECLSCYNININRNYSHLYKGQCLRECPEGTFQFEVNGYYLCEDCYKNCKSCNQRGNHINMNCEACLNDNSIKRGNNCYNVHDPDNKSFYNPENTSVITSCFELFNYYIKENTYECISSFENGFYISNNITGLVSKCHSDCKTCSKHYTNISSNCDSWKKRQR